jgi:hypothetical protein
MMTSSKSLMLGSDAGLISRSWINSLKPERSLTHNTVGWIRGNEHTLSLAQHGHVLLLIMGETLDETVHLKGVQLPITLLLLRWSAKVFPVRKEQASHAAHKCRPDTVRMECIGAYNRDESQTAAMRDSLTSAALVDAVALRFVVANGAS